MTRQFRKLAHSLYECKYHPVFCPKYGYKILQDEVKEHVIQQVYQLSSQKDGVMQIQYNFLNQHPCDLEKGHGVMFEAEARKMGIVIMRTMTGGTFAKWVDLIAPTLTRQIDFPKALLSFVLSNPLTDVALVDMRLPQWVEANCATSDDLSSRIDLPELYRRFS